MRKLPENKLNERIVRVWRLSAIINVVLWCAIVLIIVGALWGAGLADADSGLGAAAPVMGIIFFALLALAILLFVVFVFVLPKIRHTRWRYEVSEDEVDILKGIFWQERIIIPLIRVQNVDTKQGPLLRANKLASVTVSTAAGEHEIPGLAVDEADALRDRVAVLARMAQEDV